MTHSGPRLEELHEKENLKYALHSLWPLFRRVTQAAIVPFLPWLHKALPLLNVALTVGGGVVQLPQIYRILASKSAEGLSEAAVILNVVATGAFVSYNYLQNFPLLSYGDALLTLIAYIAILLLLWKYNSKNDLQPAEQLRKSASETMKRRQILIGFGVFGALTLTRCIPKTLQTIIGLAPLPLVVAARWPQILLNHRNKHTGALSGLTLTLMCLGNLARIATTVLTSARSQSHGHGHGLTSLEGVKDKLEEKWGGGGKRGVHLLGPATFVALSHLTAFVFSAVTLAQIVCYRENTHRAASKAAKVRGGAKAGDKIAEEGAGSQRGGAQSTLRKRTGKAGKIAAGPMIR